MTHRRRNGRETEQQLGEQDEQNRRVAETGRRADARIEKAAGRQQRNAGETHEAGQAAGATGWVVKPFNPDVMLKIIAKVLPA